MKSKEFREKLLKVMPGYKWTVHRKIHKTLLIATGIQSAGFCRTSTLEVCRRDNEGVIDYSVKSSGYGKNNPWLGECTRPTLKQALRSLQDSYAWHAANYAGHVSDLQKGRG